MLAAWKNYTGSLRGILLALNSCCRHPFSNHWWLLIRVVSHDICGNIVQLSQVIVSFFYRHLHDLNRRKLILCTRGFVHEISLWHISQVFVVGVIVYWRRYNIIFKTISKRIPILLFQLVMKFKGVITTV